MGSTSFSEWRGPECAQAYADELADLMILHHNEELGAFLDAEARAGRSPKLTLGEIMGRTVILLAVEPAPEI